MKPIYLIAIAIILLVAGFWYSQEALNNNSPSAPTTNSSSIGTPDQQESRQSSNRRSSSKTVTEIDWHAVAEELINRSMQFDQFQPSPANEKRLRQLSWSDLLKALPAVRTRNHTASESDRLQRYLITLLIQSDPARYCLESETVPLSEQPRLFWEGLAISEWARISPQDAIAWLDSAASETRDSRQMELLRHNLFSTLVAIDFEQAKTRLLAAPEEQRHRMFENYDGFGVYWSREDLTNHNITGNFAELARIGLPKSAERFILFPLNVRGEQDRPAGISRVQENLKDWKKGRGTWLPATTIADYLEKISATPAEQELCLDEIVRQFKYYQNDGDPTVFRKQFATEVQQIRSNK